MLGISFPESPCLARSFVANLGYIIMKVDNDPLISLGNNSIQRVKVTKSLGLMIDKALTSIEQVNLITSKVNRSLNAFNTTFKK